MKNRYIFIVLLMLLSIGKSFAQDAVQVLDNTAASLEKSGALKANFTLTVSHKGFHQGGATGEIALKGDKFVLTTPEAITYFDGKTQWSYLQSADEVTVTYPTPEELQSINPYALLYLYKNGYTATKGSLTTYKGKPIEEVKLKANQAKANISSLSLYISKINQLPLFIKATLRDGSVNDITINGYQTGLKLDDAYFKFDKKNYPSAEIIDLR